MGFVLISIYVINLFACATDKKGENLKYHCEWHIFRQYLTM